MRDKRLITYKVNTTINNQTYTQQTNVQQNNNCGDPSKKDKPLQFEPPQQASTMFAYCVSIIPEEYFLIFVFYFVCL